MQNAAASSFGFGAGGRELARRHTDTKTKRTTFQSSVLPNLGLATGQTIGPPRLTPIPSARRRGSCKLTAQKAASRYFCFYTQSTSKLAIGYKNKRYRFLDTFLLRDLAEREGFEPPEPRSSTVFKTAAIDHSATSPRDKSITSFLIYQTKSENIFKFFATTPFIMLKHNNIRMH